MDAKLVHLSYRPEIDLLMACTLPRGVSDASYRIQELVAAGLDWTKVSALASYHSVQPLLYTRLAELSPGMVPEHVLAQLAAEFRRNAARNLYLTGELIRILKVFADEGIPALPFKGPLLAQQAYGNLGLRVFLDLDLLIHPDDARRVFGLLAARGYQPNPRLRWVKPESWTRWSTEVVLQNGETCLDLHWGLMRGHYPIQLDSKTIWRSAVTTELGGFHVRSIRPEVLLLLLAVHGGKHCWGHLCLIADIAWLLDACPTVDWPAVIMAADQSGCRRPLLLALAILKDVHQKTLPANIEELVMKDREVQLLRTRAWNRLTDDPLPAPDTREFSFAAGLSEHRTRTIRHFFGLMLDPTEAEWEVLQLPASMFPLYVPFRLCRLLRKYLWRF